MKDVSIVIPVFNEADNLAILVDQLRPVLEGLKKSYECVFVDDGSIDGSFRVLCDLKKKAPFLKIVKLKKNFGQTQALMAGFSAASGDIVITMDADLQNDPGDIPALLEKVSQGYDIVSGWRVKRQDNFFTRKIPSLIANRIISFLTGVNLHDYGCTLKAYKSEVVKSLKLYGDMHRFIPAIASCSGIKITEQRVSHHPRRFGVSKYNMSRTAEVMLDLITVKFFLNYAGNPMRLFGAVGFMSFFVGFCSMLASFVMKTQKNIDITGNPLFYLTIVMGIIGMQCILLGILGEINVRMYHEILNKDTYTVEETVT